MLRHAPPPKVYPCRSPLVFRCPFRPIPSPPPQPHVFPPTLAVGNYLVATCGLTRAQILKASAKLSHLQSPTKPNVVLAFLADLGLSSGEVAALVAKDPQFLVDGVETILRPILIGFTGLGLSHSEIALLVSLVPASFRCRSVVSTLPYFMSLFGSYENLRRVLRCKSNILGSSLEKVVMPNVALLRECRLDACDIAKLCILHPRLLATKLEGVQAMVARADAIGVPRGSRMFRLALQAVAFRNKEKIATQVEFLKKTLRWSDAYVGIAVYKFPMVLGLSEEMMQSKLEFLISEVELEPAYIAHLPALLGYSLDGRLRPRYFVLKFLKEYGLLDRERSYYSAVNVSEKVFTEKYISPHSEHRTLLKTMRPLAKGKCPLDSDLYEAVTCMKTGYWPTMI